MLLVKKFSVKTFCFCQNIFWGKTVLIHHFHCLYRIGLIEWMENTCTLKEFVNSTMTEEEQQRAARYSILYTFEKWSTLPSQHYNRKQNIRHYEVIYYYIIDVFDAQ